MKKRSLKFLSVLLAISVLVSTFVIVPLTASAATPVSFEGSSYTFNVWADPDNVLDQDKVESFSTDKLATLGGIKPYKISTGNTAVYYWFLPSTADCTNLKFWFSGTFSINGVDVESGVPTDVLSEINEGGVTKQLKVVENGSSHTVNFMKSNDVATMYVNTVSGSMSAVYSSSNHTVGEAGSVMVVQPDGTVDYMGDMEKIQGRGNATWSTSNSKNPFNVKLAQSTSLLGMGKAKKWVLLANVSDSTLLRNQITYDFARYIGVKYQPKIKPIDVFINHQYYGSYMLAEKVEIGSSRIDVSDAYESLEIANGTVDEATGAIIPADLEGTIVNSLNSTNGATIGGKRYSESLINPTDVTGGYLYELEMSSRWPAEGAGFCAYNKQGWVIKSCDYASKDMVDYSYDLLFALGGAAYNGGTVPNKAINYSYQRGTSNNPAPAEQYQNKRWNDLLDEDSYYRYYWVEELFKNLDASTSSCYFYKDSDAVDSKLYAGPVWDMDKCWGSGTGTRWGVSQTSNTGWYAKNVRIYQYSGASLNSVNDTSSLFDSSDSSRPLALLGAIAQKCPDAWYNCERYWFEYVSPAIDILLGNKVDETGVLKSVSEYANVVEKSGKMNATRLSLSTYSASSNTKTLTDWVSARNNWITSQINHPSISTTTIEYKDTYTYTGAEIKPEFNITANVDKVGIVNLEEGIDYEVSYSNNIEAGTATATITGIGKYIGSLTKDFTINKANISTGFTATIDEAAYRNTLVTATLTNDENGVEIVDDLSYQWYRNDTPIADATESSYLTTDDDANTNLTVVITGNDKNVTGTVTSNACEVRPGDKPEGFTQTIATWNYDYTLDSEALTALENSNYEYGATDGELMTSSILTASVNAVDNAKIKWSGTDLYSNPNCTTASDQTPIIGTSKTSMLAWGEYPHFDVVTSTLGYENITFSARLGGSKKGPRDWKLQYSFDGIEFTDVDNVFYSIGKNKTMELAFDEVQLPEECMNQEKLYIRIIADGNTAINGVDTIINQLSGDAAINNVTVTGTSLGIVTKLNAPTISVQDDTFIYNDTQIELIDNNGGADVYYVIGDNEPVLYDVPFTLFDAKTSKFGDSVTVKAYAQFETVVSDVVEVTYHFAGVNVNQFSYDEVNMNTLGGAIASNGGVYDESGKMTATADGKSLYVPYWNDKNLSYSLSPDDGALWSANSGFTYKVSTSGFDNIKFSCKAYTTNQGPNSLTLQYSLNGVDFFNVKSNVELPRNAVLEDMFTQFSLPEICNNKPVLYIRLATTEDKTVLGDILHHNASKGNLYVNNVIVSGEDNGVIKMPYTNKATNYFGNSGSIKYVSPDGLAMRYAVRDSSNKIVAAGAYPVDGIQLYNVTRFEEFSQEPYTVAVWSEFDEDRSDENIATYYYKGDTVVKFNYNSTTRLFENYVSEDMLSAKNTSGVHEGTISMYPNGTDPTFLSYSGSYGVKVSWTEENPFVASKKLDSVNNNGYWLVETSTVGYSALTINLNQISSNKGPRDWSIAYSTDGRSYKFVKNSNVRTYSNDASTKPVESYSNFELPAECNNQEKLYIKIFINGGESVDGTELETVLKGNTGIDAIEINGIREPKQLQLEVKTPVMINPNGEYGEALVDANLLINGKAVNTENGVAVIDVTEGDTVSLKASMGKTFVTTKSHYVTKNQTVFVPVNVLDIVEDGIINGKDYAKLLHEKEDYTSIFEKFVNLKDAE